MSLHCKEQPSQQPNRIKQAQRKAQYFLTNLKLPELRSTLHNIQHIMRQYYRPSPQHFNNIPLLRLLNQQRKKQQLRVAFNYALLQYKSNQIEQTIQILLQAIEEILAAIQAEKIRLRYIGQKEELKSNLQIQKSIAFWQTQLARFYYLLAFADKQSCSKQISYSAVLKALQIIKELYESCLKNTDQAETQYKSLIQLLVLCKLHQELMHSKVLSKIKPEELSNLIHLVLSEEISLKNVKDASDLGFVFQKLAGIQLRVPQQKDILNQPTSQVNLNTIVILHFICLCLLIELEEPQDQDQCSQQNNKLLNILIAGFISKTYIMHTIQTSEMLQRLRKNYVVDDSPYHETVDLPHLLSILNKKPQKLNKSISLGSLDLQDSKHQNQYQKVVRNKPKKLTKNTIPGRKRSTKSKQKKKTKKQISKGKSLEKIQQNKGKAHRQKVQHEYKLKGRVTSKNNHLVEAINRNGNQAKKQKSKPKAQRHSPSANVFSQKIIRSETTLESCQMKQHEKKRQKTIYCSNKWRL